MRTFLWVMVAMCLLMLLASGLAMVIGARVCGPSVGAASTMHVTYDLGAAAGSEPEQQVTERVRDVALKAGVGSDVVVSSERQGSGTGWRARISYTLPGPRADEEARTQRIRDGLKTSFLNATVREVDYVSGVVRSTMRDQMRLLALTVLVPAGIALVVFGGLLRGQKRGASQKPAATCE